MRRDGEPVGPGTRTTRLSVRPTEAAKQTGTSSTESIKARGANHRIRRPNTGRYPTAANMRIALQCGSHPHRTLVSRRPSCRPASNMGEISGRRCSPEGYGPGTVSGAWPSSRSGARLVFLGARDPDLHAPATHGADRDACVRSPCRHQPLGYRVFPDPGRAGGGARDATRGLRARAPGGSGQKVKSE